MTTYPIPQFAVKSRLSGERLYRRLALSVALLVVAIVPSPAAARVVTGCDSVACKTRVAHKKSKRKKLRLIAPYRAWLSRVRLCESGGRYATATGNGFYGAYQFDASTWRGVGGRGLAHQASRIEQDYRAVLLRLRRGTAPWPRCGR